ncbi:MAG: DUF1499 domain-containing protein [Deltaproteobacteria bacterium]|nr:DUF1499 domain-containing protein [Deltaproteobacteria bacterium]
MNTLSSSRPLSPVALGGFLLAVLAGLGLLLSGVSNRLQWLDFRPALTLFRWAAYGGAAALALSIIGMILTRSGSARSGFGLAACGLVVSLVVVVIPLRWFQQVQRVPFIHDISTDLENPPLFVAVLPLRVGAPNPAEYGGPEVAAQQRQGYPDLAPLFLQAPLPRAFEHALATARAMGWEIVVAEAGEGRIEATTTTFWFGFKDDVVVRVLPTGSGSRIDVRSVSRVGRSDVGTNAARITAYLARMAKDFSS